MRSLIVGEDFSTDPVSRLIGLVLGRFTHGQLVVDVRVLSQVPLVSLRLGYIMYICDQLLPVIVA